MNIKEQTMQHDTTAEIIRNGVTQAVAKVVEEEVAKAQKEVAAKIRARVGEIACAVLDSYDMTYGGGHALVITVKFPDQTKSLG